MKAGLIENWSDIEDIWEYMLYSELGIEEGSNPILVTEVANTPRKNREKMAEVRFHWICVCNARTMFLCLLIPWLAMSCTSEVLSIWWKISPNEFNYLEILCRKMVGVSLFNSQKEFHPQCNSIKLNTISNMQIMRK